MIAIGSSPLLSRMCRPTESDHRTLGIEKFGTERVSSTISPVSSRRTKCEPEMTRPTVGATCAWSGARSLTAILVSITRT